MTVFQWFFFAGDRVDYWENVECEVASSIESLLRDRMAGQEWGAAEAWRDNNLICRVVRHSDGKTAGSDTCPLRLADEDLSA